MDASEWDRLFPTGIVLDEERQIGRDQFILAVEQRLAEGQHVLLAGDRQIGKSSVLRAAGQRRARAGVPVAFLDLFSPHDTAAKFSRAATSGLAVASLRLEQRTAGFLRVVTAAGADAARLKTLADQVSGPPPDLTAGLVEVAEVLRRSGRQALMIVDEAQVMETWGDDGQRLLTVLLRLAQTEGRPLVLGLASSDEEALSRVLSERFLWLLETHQIPPIAREAWYDGITGRYSKVGLQADSDALDLIVDAFDGHPFKTMWVARGAGRLAHGSGEVATQHVLASVDEARSQPWAEL